MPLPKLGYCIAVVRGGRACTLDGMAVSLEKGARSYPKGLHLGANLDGYSFIEELSEDQVLLTFRFTAADVLKKPDGAGELVVRRAELISKDELLPEENFILDGPISESLILERLSFDQLLRYSDPKRVARADTVRGPALKLTAAEDSTYWWFNFKSFPSTTGLRHKGYIRFIRPRGMIDPTERRPLEQVHCEVDCQCPDYKYRWAWSNKQRQASRVGAQSLNQCINRAPRITNPTNRPGLCKHLLALRNFIYGQAFMLGNTRKGDPTDRMEKLVKHSTKRWLDFDGEVYKARQKERERQSAMNTLRRDPLRANGPVPRVPGRVGDMPVPEVPALDASPEEMDAPAPPPSTPLEQIAQNIDNPPEEPTGEPAAKPVVPPRTGGYDTPAEFNFRRRIGDSSYQQRHAMKKLLQEAHNTLNSVCEEEALPTEQAVVAEDPTLAAPEDGLTVLCEIRDILRALSEEPDPTAAVPDELDAVGADVPEAPAEEPGAKPEGEEGNPFDKGPKKDGEEDEEDEEEVAA